jgi:hypothetical protein
MIYSPGEEPAVERARWLAELSKALDDAERTLWRLLVNPAESPVAMELYLRIEAARREVESLRVRPNHPHADQSGPLWTKQDPWGRSGSDVA